jgi:hypothetical protein
MAAVYALYSLFRHWHFQSSAYDLGIFDQIVWSYSRGQVPASSLRGMPNMLGDHLHPIPSPWPNRSPAVVAALLSERVERGYSVAASERGWVLLRRLPGGRFR